MKKERKTGWKWTEGEKKKEKTEGRVSKNLLRQLEIEMHKYCLALIFSHVRLKKNNRKEAFENICAFIFLLVKVIDYDRSMKMQPKLEWRREKDKRERAGKEEGHELIIFNLKNSGISNMFSHFHIISMSNSFCIFKSHYSCFDTFFIV